MRMIQNIFADKIFLRLMLAAALAGIFLFAFYLSLGFFVTYFLNAQSIEKYVKSEIGLDIILENPTVRTMPDLSFVLCSKRLEAGVKAQNKVFFSAINPNLRVRILPLFLKKLSVVSFDSADLALNVSRDKNSVFDFEKYIPGGDKLPFKADFKRTRLNIAKAGINFTDFKYEKKITLNSDKFKVYDFTAGKLLHADINANSKICSVDGKNCVSTDLDALFHLRIPVIKYLDSKAATANVSLKNFDSRLILPYVNELSKLKFDKLSGIYNLDISTKKDKSGNVFLLNISTKDVGANFILNNKNSSVTLKDPALLKLKFKASDNEIRLFDSLFSSRDTNVAFDGRVSKYKSEKPVPDINLKIAESDFMKFIHLIPAGFVVYKTDVINELIKINPHARVQGGLNISGNYKKPDVKGLLDVSDIYLFGRPRGFKSANAECEFVGDKVNVDVEVYAPNSQYVKVKGVSELYGRQSGDYDIVSSENVNLAFAHKHLIPVQRVVGFKLGPLPCMKIDGTGKIHIRAKGTIYDALVDGKFFGKNIKTSLNGLNTELYDGVTEIDFNGKVVNIVNTSAKTKDGTFMLSGFADDYGNIDIKSEIKNISALHALNIAKTSDIIKPITGDLSFIKAASGKCDLTVIFKGKAKSLEGLDFLNDISPAGSVVFKNTGAVLAPHLSVSGTNGKIVFTKDYMLDLSSMFKSSKITLKGTITPDSKNLMNKDTKLKLNIDSALSGMRFSDILEIIKEQNCFNDKRLKFLVNNTPLGEVDFAFDSKVKITGSMPVNFALKDLSGITLNGIFKPLNTQASKNIKFKRGTYTLEGHKIKLTDSNITVFGADVFSDGEIRDIFSKPRIDMKIKADSIALSNLENLANYTNIALFKAMLADFGSYKGSMDLNLNIRKNSPRGSVSFNNVSAYNSKQGMELALKSGGIRLLKNKLILDSLNFTYGTTPLYFNATVADYLTEKPVFSAFFTTNIDENATDRLVNPYLVYPFKVRGEILLSGRIKGDLNNYSVFSRLLLPRDTDISYMGANVGDSEYEREFESSADFTKNTAKINSAKYIKYIPSQNNKPTPVTMLKVNGRVISKNDRLSFDNLRVVSENPVTAKIFNVIFKKSVLKQGLFTCNLNLNGNVELPAATGKINFQNINIPLYNTKISDMDFVITKKSINGLLRGKSFDSDVQITADIQNKQSFPIVLNELNIKSKKASLSSLLEGISQIPRGSSDIVPGQPIVFKPQDLVILKGSASVDEVELYDIKAHNLKADFSNPTGFIFNIDDMRFDIAGGSITSRGNFDVVSLVFDIDSVVSDCDANTLSENFLGLENQIYGRTNAKINLKGKVPQNAEDIKSVNGRVDFSVNNGKMPKLGSLEYLLRAGNLIKSGLFGLTLNNLIEVLTPYKTGEFSAIRGNFEVNNAKIHSLEIFSKGKNLSLFIYGDYDIINDNAEIEILGRLSKNVSNLLGSFGNTSLNSIFNALTGNKIKEGAKEQIIKNVNKIPLIEISGDDYRLFLAKIKGQLNSDDYVKSFNWLN